MCDCRLPRDLLKEYFAAVTELSYRLAATVVLCPCTEEGFKSCLCLGYGEFFFFLLTATYFQQKAEVKEYKLSSGKQSFVSCMAVIQILSLIFRKLILCLID
jgi:hypothetical protein